MIATPLAPYACDPARSRGRLIPEPESPTRTPHQRDRDRVIHAAAFRRLSYKTQVFVYHEGDYYRTRLSHSLEVAQIARSIGRALRLNEDLARLWPWLMTSVIPRSAMPARTRSARPRRPLAASTTTPRACASSPSSSSATRISTGSTSPGRPWKAW